MSDFSKLKTKKNGKEYILNACTQDTEQNITGTKNFTKLTVNSKNVVTSINGLPASICKWETDFFDIAPSGLYSFDLSNTPFANIPREEINIQMVGKVKTVQNGFKVGDYVYPQFANYVGASGSTEIGSTPYISGNVLSIKFGNSSDFVTAVPNDAIKGIDKTDVKVKLILTALIGEV